MEKESHNGMQELQAHLTKAIKLLLKQRTITLRSLQTHLNTNKKNTQHIIRTLQAYGIINTTKNAYYLPADKEAKARFIQTLIKNTRSKKG